MASFRFEEAAYSHRCSKIETADEIRTRANRNFQNEYLEISEQFITNNYLFSKLECQRNYGSNNFLLHFYDTSL